MKCFYLIDYKLEDLYLVQLRLDAKCDCTCDGFVDNFHQERSQTKLMPCIKEIYQNKKNVMLFKGKISSNHLQIKYLSYLSRGTSKLFSQGPVSMRIVNLFLHL